MLCSRRWRSFLRPCLLSGFLVVSVAVSVAAPGKAPDLPTAAAPIASVLGEPLSRDTLVAVSTEHHRKTMSPEEFAEWQVYSHNKLLVTAIRAPLIKAYAEREGLEPTTADKRTYLNLLRGPADKAANQAGADDPAMVRVRNEFATRVVRDYKVGRALWKEHGGTVGFGSLGGCMPFEAQQAFLRAEVEAGRLVFHDPQTEEQFWNAIMDKGQLADVVVEEPARIESYFAWMLEGKSWE